jgi:hyperosmotically inducible protein
MRGISKLGGIALLGAALIAFQPGAASAAASDGWITAKTKIALFTTKGVSSTAINVDTVDGVVTLHGKVYSADEKAKAEAEAKKIDGVKEVRNLLQVVPEKAEKTVKTSDNEIKDRVGKALKDDKTLDDSSISVQSVNNGVVLLAGKANSVGDHLEAIERAYAVPGVRRVESEVQSPDRLADEEIRRESEHEGATAGVKRGIGGTVKDMFITTDVKMRLMADDKTPGTDINVDTRNGVVNLFGMVPTAAAKTAAEADARKVSGVTRVINELEVVPKAKQEMVEAKDDQLKDQIERKFEDRKDLEGADLKVEVKNGVARLTGTVENESQRLAAAIAARSTPGVRAVHDELRFSSARH